MQILSVLRKWNGKGTARQSKSNRSPKQIDRALRDEYLDLYSYCSFLVMQREVFLLQIRSILLIWSEIRLWTHDLYILSITLNVLHVLVAVMSVIDFLFTIVVAIDAEAQKLWQIDSQEHSFHESFHCQVGLHI